MHEEDEEWLLEWINSCKDEKFSEIGPDDWNVDIVEEHYSSAEASLFKAGVNTGIQKALDVYNKKFYEYQGREIEKAEKELEEIEKELDELSEEEAEEKREHIKETRQIIEQMKKKRENFLKPMIEGNIEEAAEGGVEE